MEYPKIQTVFKRDEKGIIIPTELTLDEFGYLKDNIWECTEKIDGTNIRIEIDFLEEDIHVEYKGRTDRAIIPEHLLAKLKEIFGNVDWQKTFPNWEPGMHVTIYGEGYGKKIQAVGGRYLSNEVSFILFDVRVGNWWLRKEDCEILAVNIGVQTVPFIGYMTLTEAMDYVATGFKSAISEDRTLDAEGLVLKTPQGLMFRNGQRIIAKLKTCDFRKWEAAYGNMENPIQKVNEHCK